MPVADQCATLTAFWQENLAAPQVIRKLKARS